MSQDFPPQEFKLVTKDHSDSRIYMANGLIWVEQPSFGEALKMLREETMKQTELDELNVIVFAIPKDAPHTYSIKYYAPQVEGAEHIMSFKMHM